MPLQQAAGSRQQPNKQSLHLKKPLAMENPIAKNSKNLRQTTVKVRQTTQRIEKLVKTLKKPKNYTKEWKNRP